MQCPTRDVLAAMIRHDGSPRPIVGVFENMMAALRPNMHKSCSFERAHNLSRLSEGSRRAVMPPTKRPP